MSIVSLVLALSLAPAAVGQDIAEQNDGAELAGAAPMAEPAATERSRARCAVLIGDQAQRDANEQRRADSMVRIANLDDEILIVHSEPTFGVPQTVRLDGIEVVEVVSEGDQPQAIKLALSGPLGETCGTELTLSVDDSVGRALQVAWIGDGGALLMADDDLVWLGAEAKVPTFQMVWRSSFSVEVDSGTAKKPAKKKAKKRKPKKRKK